MLTINTVINPVWSETIFSVFPVMGLGYSWNANFSSEFLLKESTAPCCAVRRKQVMSKKRKTVSLKF